MSDEMNENKKGKSVITVIIVLVLLAVTATTVFFILKAGSKKKGGKPGAFGGFGAFGGSQTYSVKTMAAQPETLHDYVLTNGEIETQSSIQVFPSIGGKVVEVYVSLGTAVKKGDLIAKIDPSEPGSYYALSSVTAPISGSILSSPSKPGNKVSASTVITTIGDIENLQISANVPERYVAALKPGLKAEITLEAYPGEVFGATVADVSPVLDAATRTKKVVLIFDKNDSRIDAGMFARVKLYTLDYSDFVTVPQNSFTELNGEFYLYVVNEDGETVRKVKAEKGKTVDGVTQVASGINKGDLVVVEGMLSLYDGAKILDITNGVKNEDKPKGELPKDFDPSKIPEQKPNGGR
ncbi:MAG: efflux RND transporter periplasmic adaptor subunit [Treponema sp.]|nr:efflux RND transporter periplasmic adaptor subunit [Treponema sp.]